MRESKYIESYLDAAAKHRWTVGTFLARTLRGRAKEYGGRYKDALDAALARRIESGEVVRVESAGKRDAFVRRSDL